MEISDLNLSDADLQVPPRPNMRSTARNNASRFEDLEFTEFSDVDLFPKPPKVSTPQYRQSGRNVHNKYNNILSPRLGTEEVNRHFIDFSFANNKQFPDHSFDRSIEIGRGLARNASNRNINRQTSMSSNGSPKPTKVTDKQATPKKAYFSEIEDKAKKNGIVIPTEYRDDESFFKSLNIPTRNQEKKSKPSQETRKDNSAPKKPTHPSDTDNAAVLPDVTGLSSIFSSDTGSTRRRNRDTGHKTIVSVPMDPDDQALFTAFNSFEQKIARLEKERNELNERLEALSKGDGAAAQLKKQDDQLRELKERYNEEAEKYEQMEAKARKYKSAILTLRERYLAQQYSDDNFDANQWRTQYDKLKSRAQELAFEKDVALEEIRAKEQRIAELERLSELADGDKVKSPVGKLPQQAPARVSFDDPTSPQSAPQQASVEFQPQTPQPTKTVNGQIISLLLRTLEQQTLDDKENKRKTMVLLQQFVDMEEKEREEQLEAEEAAADAEKLQVIEALQDALQKLQSSKTAPVTVSKAAKLSKSPSTRKSKKPKVKKTKAPKKRVELEVEEDTDTSGSDYVDMEDSEDTSGAITESEQESELESNQRPKKKTPVRRKSSTASEPVPPIPTLMNRVFGEVPRECETCLRNGISRPSAGVWGQQHTCPHGNTYPTRGFPRRHSRDLNDEETIRPSMSPEESAKIVLDKMTEEWRELQEEYLALTDDYNGKNPAKHRRKRSELAERIKIIVNEMESKADQIYAMHDVMTAANLPTTFNPPAPPASMFFDDQSVDGNDNDDTESLLDREQYLGKTEWLNA